MSWPPGHGGVPALLLTFDDNSPTVYDEAFAYMDTYNMPGTFYVIGSSVASLLTDLQAMDAAGWDIANHTQTHAHWSSLTQAEIETELTDAQATLEAEGFTRASRHVSYPGGYTDEDGDAAMAAAGMLTGREGIQEIDHYLPVVDWYSLNVEMFPGNTTTLQDTLNWVISTIGKGKIGIIAFHKLVAEPSTSTEWGIVNFQTLIDYIAATGIDVLTISELYAL